LLNKYIKFLDIYKKIYNLKFLTNFCKLSIKL